MFTNLLNFGNRYIISAVLFFAIVILFVLHLAYYVHSPKIHELKKKSIDYISLNKKISTLVCCFRPKYKNILNVTVRENRRVMYKFPEIIQTIATFTSNQGVLLQL